MRSTRVVPRASAIRDAEDATDYYIQEASDAVAYRFIEALLAAYGRLEENPEVGSRRLGESLGISGLRTWHLRGFPYVVCYEVLTDSVDIWRILHAQSDIPQHLSSADN